MKHPVMFGTAALALAAAIAAQPPLAQAQSGTALHGKTSGHCKLANVQYGREMYNGACTIRQRIDGSSNFYSIQMGAAEPFLFATSDGKTWMHGPEQVRFPPRAFGGLPLGRLPARGRAGLTPRSRGSAQSRRAGRLRAAQLRGRRLRAGVPDLRGRWLPIPRRAQSRASSATGSPYRGSHRNVVLSTFRGAEGHVRGCKLATGATPVSQGRVATPLVKSPPAPPVVVRIIVIMSNVGLG